MRAGATDLLIALQRVRVFNRGGGGGGGSVRLGRPTAKKRDGVKDVGG